MIAGQLLADSVTQDYWYGQTEHPEDAGKGYQIVEVSYNPGVTDPVRDSVMKAIKDMGVPNVHAAATAKRYLINGEITPA
jgi:phosphoribosylformylglycinamidine synthase